MNKGIGLANVADEVERQRAARQDLHAPTKAIVMTPDTNLTLKGSPFDTTFGIRDLAHQQIGQYVDIPKAYYDAMREKQPALLAENVNTWLGTKSERRFVRTLDGNVRAFLSDRYRPLDNLDLMGAVLPTLQQHGVEVLSADITETRLYIKAILPTLAFALPKGYEWGTNIDIAERRITGKVFAAVTISNSEVGHGSLSIAPSLFEHMCTNLHIMRDRALRKYHVGRRVGDDGEGDEAWTLYRDETRIADDKALWLKVRDIVGAAFSDDTFKALTERMTVAADQHLETDDLTAVVEVIEDHFTLPKALDRSLLTALARGGRTDRLAVAQAVTWAANQQTDYSLSTAMEQAGGDILSDDGAWRTIAKANVKPKRVTATVVPA